GPRRRRTDDAVGDLAALALNRKGVERAVAAGFENINLVVSASTAHSRANAGRTPPEAIADLAEVVADHPQVKFSGGVATAFVCPVEGEISAETVVEIAEAYRRIGVGRIGLADTVGTANPAAVQASLEQLRERLPDIAVS